MISAGTLNHQAYLYQPTTTQVGARKTTVDGSPLGPFWIGIEPVGGTETVINEKQTAYASHVLTMRGNLPKPKATDFFLTVVGSRRFEVVSVQNVNENGVFYRIQVKEKEVEA